MNYTLAQVECYLNAIADQHKEQLKQNAITARLAQAEQSAWVDFMDQL
jgi:hypothetical protein